MPLTLKLNRPAKILLLHREAKMNPLKLLAIAASIALGATTAAAQSPLPECTGDQASWTECSGTVELKDGTIVLDAVG
jgi:hypothetical protein